MLYYLEVIPPSMRAHSSLIMWTTLTKSMISWDITITESVVPGCAISLTTARQCVVLKSFEETHRWIWAFAQVHNLLCPPVHDTRDAVFIEQREAEERAG